LTLCSEPSTLSINEFPRAYLLAGGILYMKNEQFDLGKELAHLLPHTTASSESDGGSAITESRFEALMNAMRPYLSAEQTARLDRALELAALLKSAKAVLPKLGGALGI
jgi:hypothetical protein